MGNLTRDQWKERLLKAQIAEDVIDGLLKELSDDDLLRLKDMTDVGEDEFVAALKESLDTDTTEEETPPAADESTPDEDDAVMTKAFEALGDYTVSRVEAIIKDRIAVDMPDVSAISDSITSLSAVVTEMASQVSAVKDILDEVLKDDTTRLKDIAANLSPAQRSRMRVALDEGSTFDRVFKALKDKNDVSPIPGLEALSKATIDDGVIKDAEGNSYNSMSEFFHGIVK